MRSFCYSIVVMMMMTFAYGAQLSKNNDCKMSILVRDYDEWHDIVEGFMYGFYKHPATTVDKCDFCDAIGKRYGGMQIMVADLMANKNQWTTLSYFNSLSFFDKVRFFVGLFL